MFGMGSRGFLTVVLAGVLYRVCDCCYGVNGADTKGGSRASACAGILNGILAVVYIMICEGVGWSSAWGLG